MSRKKPYSVQVKLTERQAAAIVDLIDDELNANEDDLDPDELSRLRSGKKAINEALWRLDRRLERLELE